MIAAILTGAALPYFFIDRQVSLPGFSVRGPLRSIDPQTSRLLLDVTAFDPLKKERVFSHEIFDEILAMIGKAESFIMLDFFLWNSWQGVIPESRRRLSTELAEALIDRKAQSPDLLILAMTDPINRIYGNDEEDFFHDMVAAGIPVIFTDIDRLPPSNMGYTPWATAFLEPLSRLPGIRRLFDWRFIPNVFDPSGPRLKGRQIMNLLHFRANHRKLIIIDLPGGNHRLLVPSLNPADGSSAHSNVGLRVDGQIALDALVTTLDCAQWSAENPSRILEREPGEAQGILAAIRGKARSAPASEPSADEPAARWLTEGAVRDKILLMLHGAVAGDEVKAGLFYLSDRDVVRALADAANRGAHVRLILDANRDAFGRKKNGVPNRPVAAELLRRTRDSGRLQIRWAATHGEQYHSKVLAITNPGSDKHLFLCGSSNWTRRNLKDLNLESAVYLRNVPTISGEFSKAFDEWWTNSTGLLYTAGYETLKDSGWALRFKTWQYRFQEKTGMSTF